MQLKTKNSLAVLKSWIAPSAVVHLTAVIFQYDVRSAEFARSETVYCSNGLKGPVFLVLILIFKSFDPSSSKLLFCDRKTLKYETFQSSQWALCYTFWFSCLLIDLCVNFWKRMLRDQSRDIMMMSEFIFYPGLYVSQPIAPTQPGNGLQLSWRHYVVSNAVSNQGPYLCCGY